MVDDMLYLFLFACRAEGVEQALDHIFQLSWRELFIGRELLVTPESLSAPAFMDETQPVAPVADAASVPMSKVRAVLQPRPISLPRRGKA